MPATATTKKTNWNNKNNDGDCNTTDLINLQDVCSKQVRPFRFVVELYNTGDGDGDKGSVIIRFRTYRYQYRQQQKSISDFDTYRYRYNNNNKRRSGSSFCLRERRLAHFVGINIMGGMGADYQQQQQQRKQIGTTTTTMMMIVIRPIRSTYRMYVRNKRSGSSLCL